MKRMKKTNNKSSYSKKLCALCIGLFISVVLASVIGVIFNFNTEIFAYLIPSSAAMATASVGFYYNKAKAENLSKQKLRNVVLKLTLEDKINSDEYYEIIEEIENIDETVNMKLDSLYQDAINEDTNIEIGGV